jgi:hypothetical protein
MNETCARCGCKFECKPADIAHCQCSTITLSSEKLAFIASKFTNCLCANCLQELQSEFSAQELKPLAKGNISVKPKLRISTF